MGRWLQILTPLILLVLALLVWFEKLLPGAEGARRVLGETGLLRFAVGILCLYVLVLVVERQRMEAAFKGVLKAFRDFHQARAGEAADPKRAVEAARLLVAALDSEDEDIRQSSLEHLRRVTGQDFGMDRERWKRWLAGQEAGSGAQG